MKGQEFLDLLEQENILEEDLPSLLTDELIKKKKKVASAESCTGGMISMLITSVSGASGVFDCGICSYANHIKHNLLSVKEETLSTYGAVSDRTAMEMARGVRLLSKSDIGISTTGIAGPLGGTKYKPVGLVYVGVSTEMGLVAHKLLLNDVAKDRERIRELASAAALYFAYKSVRDM
ncbi:MAG: CinA family protein [Ruminococcus sp.]|nr:CinA family protein [Ruminococcus sp.]